jgi:soluble lytic murein transglycosylase-like protein
MRSRFLRIAAVTAALLAGVPAAAHAQIYTWRDAAGTLVLSDHLIAEHASVQGVRADLVHAVIQAESAFNPMARSVKGAMGLMQLMPATAVQFGVTNAFDPAQNIRAGVAYLKRLLERYSQNEELALAAYNAGPGAVEKYGAVPPYRETRDYVSRIRSRAGAPAPATRVYRVVESKDGREVVRYTNAPATADVVASRQ